MKKFTKVSVTAVAVSSILVLIGPLTAFALATSPSLGAAASFSVLSGTPAATNQGTGQTIISGDFGVYPASAYTDTAGNKTIFQTVLNNPYLNGGPGATTALDAQNAQLSVFNNSLSSQSCDHNYGTTELSTLNTGGGNGVLDPGIYCSSGNFTLSGTLALHGTGSPATDVWIFKSATDLIVSSADAAKVVFSGTGGYACNVWWRVANDATFDGANVMVGNILAHNAIHFGQGATLDGRAFAYSANVTLLGNVISGPTCAAAAAAAVTAPLGLLNTGTITVVKTVVNDSGGTKKVADFPLFVNGTANGHQPVVSGETNTFFTNGLYPYTVTETSDPNYTATFSGDCDSTGFLNLRPGDQKVCIITNNDKGAPLPVVPPLIDLVKTASPLSLPAGPGSVVYTYTLRNIGTVPVTDITIVGDTCSPIVRISGDTNGDNKLDLNETWVHSCTQSLSATHTNTAVATGWANGISATDIASATVVVGLPIIPPLIHVVKVPSVFTLSAPGGAVTYSYTVTNPGTAPLSDVSITDNKCTGLPGRVVGHPGDLNKNNLLDPGETWQFTCKTNLTQTTTNIGTAEGSANGLTARDIALATVVVAAPGLPNTGLPPYGTSTPLDAALAGGILMMVLASLAVIQKRRKA